MLKAHELRIGNFVKAFKTYWQITGGDICRFDNEDGVPYEPIHLTHEILVKAGFTKYLSSDKVLHHFFKGENPITHDWMIDLKWIIGREYPFYKNGYHEIKYLHQIQNLYYALTGEELEINLSNGMES